MKTPTLPRFGLIGHRGVRGLAPENTHPGFRLAKKLGLSWVEFDVQLSKEGEWVLFHDDTLDRLTAGKATGAIHHHSLATLKTFDVGSHFSSAYQGTPIPTLHDTLKQLLSLGLFPNIEVKWPADTPHALSVMGKTLCACIERIWPTQGPQPLISSFQHDMLFWLSQHTQRYPLGYLFENLADAKTYPFGQPCDFSIHFDWHQNHERALIQEMLQHGYPLIPYTINDVPSLQQALEAGCAGIFTDCPQKFIPNLC